MRPNRLGSIVRSIHIFGVIGTFIYWSWSRDPVFAASLKFGAIPVLGITGIALWQHARVLRTLRSRPAPAR